VLERLHFIFSDSVGKGTQGSDSTVALNYITVIISIIIIIIPNLQSAYTWRGKSTT